MVYQVDPVPLYDLEKKGSEKPQQLKGGLENKVYI
jgi:hypothetical protein